MLQAKRDRTGPIIARMLKENTGAHMLDSGGAYGRHWSRNQTRDFRKEPETFLKFEINDAGDWSFDQLTHNLYHFLTQALAYAPEWDRRFRRFARKAEWKQEDWGTVQDAFIKSLKAEGREVSIEWDCNTYNGEDLLSQVIQYQVIDIDEDRLVWLRIHGGCDVRGGYTAPRFFWYDESGCPSIHDNARATIYCTGNMDHHWDTDDGGYHWYYDGGSIRDDDPRNLKTAPGLASDVDPKPLYDDRQLTIPGLDPDKVRQLHEYRGYLRVDSQGKGYCPLCGHELKAGF